MVFSVDILYKQIRQELVVQEQKSEWEEGRKEGRKLCKSRRRAGGTARPGNRETDGQSPWLGFFWAFSLRYCIYLVLFTLVGFY